VFPFDVHAQWRVTLSDDTQVLACTRCVGEFLIQLELNAPITLVRIAPASTRH
jgi:hypothetical protein